jgi:hypothetical protein
MLLLKFGSHSSLTSARRLAVIASVLALSSLSSASAYAAQGPACFYNDTGRTVYYSVRWSSGNTNFVLRPGERHRLNNMNDEDTILCTSWNPMTSDCPGRYRLVVNNC